jgi:hypothetical protein
MSTPTYVPIATQTLTSATNIFTFSSIPGTFKDLVFVFNGVGAANTANFFVRLNGDATNSYRSEYFAGNGSTAAQSQMEAGDNMRVKFYTQVSDASRMLIIFNFMDYAATDKHKTTLIRTNSPSFGLEAVVNRWANTAAITSVSFQPAFGVEWAAGTTASIYGIVA